MNLNENNIDENLIENIKKIVSLILYGEKKNSYFIDLFIENNILNKFSLAFDLAQDDFINYNIIKEFYLLIVNIKSIELLNYIISNKIVNKLLSYEWDLSNDEISIFIINFCKSLSLKFNNFPIEIWYNKNNQHFPLLYQTFRYYNSNDSLINTTVFNIICNIINNNNKNSISKIIKSYPFNKIFVFIIFKINQNLEQINNTESIYKTKTILSELIDVLDIFKEIINIDQINFNNFFNKIIFSFFVLKPSISSIINNNKFYKNPIGYWLIYNIILKTNKELINLIFSLFFKKLIPKEILFYLKEEYQTLLNFNNIDKENNLFDNSNSFNKNQLNFIYNEFYNIKDDDNNGGLFKNFFKNIFDNIYNKKFLSEIIIYEKVTGEHLYKNTSNIDIIQIFQNTKSNLVTNNFLIKNWKLINNGNERILWIILIILNELFDRNENKIENYDWYDFKKYQDELLNVN